DRRAPSGGAARIGIAHNADRIRIAPAHGSAERSRGGSPRVSVGVRRAGQSLWELALRVLCRHGVQRTLTTAATRRTLEGKRAVRRRAVRTVRCAQRRAESWTSQWQEIVAWGHRWRRLMAASTSTASYAAHDRANSARLELAAKRIACTRCTTRISRPW